MIGISLDTVRKYLSSLEDKLEDEERSSNLYTNLANRYMSSPSLPLDEKLKLRENFNLLSIEQDKKINDLLDNIGWVLERYPEIEAEVYPKDSELDRILQEGFDIALQDPKNQEKYNALLNRYGLMQKN